MLQQVQAIPLFELRKGPLQWISQPRINPQFLASLTGLTAQFTEFYCVSGGNNINAGSDQNTTAKYTATNGGWDATNFIYTPSDGSNPASSGVKPGDFASIYIDGATTAVCSGLITQVVNGVNGTITVHGTQRIGNYPATSASAR